MVREPYHPPEGSYRIRKGLVKEGESLVVSSQIREGRLYLDGPRIVHEVDIGQELRFSRSEEPLTLLAFPRASV